MHPSFVSEIHTQGNNNCVVCVQVSRHATITVEIDGFVEFVILRFGGKIAEIVTFSSAGNGRNLTYFI